MEMKREAKKQKYVYGDMGEVLQLMVVDKSKRQVHLYNPTTNDYEVYVYNKHFAGYTLPFKNTRLEFCYGYKQQNGKALLEELKKDIKGELFDEYNEKYNDENCIS